jgi:UDP-N-acetylglucosamine--N-acetylmuramyl-(pentapeptide) pyrophosphoryl-undecaprenol N-acetylglucosamine transferase
MAFRVIVAGGGTGGHFFPGLAVAQAVMKKRPDAEVLFVGGKKGIEARLAPHYGFSFTALPVAGFAGLSAARRLKAVALVPVAFAMSLTVLLKFKPHAVAGVGGYASFPLCLAAAAGGVPVVLLEQNVFPGITNRLLSRAASLVCVAFPQSVRFFRGKARLLGNPVRAALASVGPEGPPAEPFRLLVFGGSRGARPVNNAVIGALPALEAFPGGIEIVHQTGADDLQKVRDAYEKTGLPARVEPFLYDMEKEYAWCHAVLCRAGATTMAELAAAARPALIVPFPQAAAGHQLANARGLEELGGALCIEQEALTTQALTAALEQLADPAKRAAMARALKKVARPDAADRIADVLLIAGEAA